MTCKQMAQYTTGIYLKKKCMNFWESKIDISIQALMIKFLPIFFDEISQIFRKKFKKKFKKILTALAPCPPLSLNFQKKGNQIPTSAGIIFIN